MSETVWNNILASLWLIIWVITLLWYQWKSRIIDGGTAIIASYILYAIFSLFTLNDIMFSDVYKPLTVFPYIYLYLMLLMALTPAIYFHINSPNNIESPRTKILTLISLVIFICSLLLIPDIVNNFSTGLVKLFTETDAGKDAYMEQSKEASDAGSGISNLPAIIYNATSDITIFLFFYFMTVKKKNYWLIAALGFSVIIGILIPIMHGQRGSVIIAISTAIVGYMMFRKYISKRFNNAVQIVGLSAILMTALPIGAITVSRFGQMGGGVVGFLNWYVGQGTLYFNNFALDAGGTRNGDRTFNLVKRMIDSDTPANYTERRDKYHNMNISDEIFTTFVGDFVIDFGPIVAVVIFILFNAVILYLIRPRDGTVKLHQLLLLYFTLCICMQGGMSLYSYSDTGNLRILILLMLYAYLRYHEILLQKFPLLKKEPQ